jgi:hypothetical protein
MAGFDALTLSGRGKSAEEFVEGQLVEGGTGALLGPLAAKVAPYVGRVGGAALKLAERVPGVQFVEEKAVQAVGNLAKKATDSFVIAEADQQAIQAADRALGKVGQELSEFGRKALTDEVGAVGDVDAVRRALAARDARALGAADNTAERAEFEAYKDSLRAAMEKPPVVDSELAGLMEDLYRPGATVGSGSTAAAVREEAAKGVRVGGRLHAEKAQNYITALKRWLAKNPTSGPGDRAAAENVIRDMENALEGK